nr:MAG TPA: hypothetical protein [Caudoviricetes sp.]DAG42092.1 MAG TPA: hypothetical protein [Caudoviricetes sp.]
MMNPRRKRQSFELWENQPMKSPSGSIKDNWIKLEKSIFVSLYDQSAQNQLTFGSSGVRINKYDYLGLTTNKTLVASKYQLRNDTMKLMVKGVNNEGRLAQLFLEVLADG